MACEADPRQLLESVVDEGRPPEEEEPQGRSAAAPRGVALLPLLLCSLLLAASLLPTGRNARLWRGATPGPPAGNSAEAATALSVQLLLIQQTFHVFPHFDFPDEGDVAQREIRTAQDVLEVKRLVVQERYAGFSLRGGTAYMKAAPPEGPGSPENLTFMGADDAAFFFLLVDGDAGEGDTAASFAAAEAIANLVNGQPPDYTGPLCQDDGLQAEFSSYRFYDLPDVGDVGEPLPVEEFELAIHTVKAEGLSGFSVRDGKIFLKSVDGGLTVDWLKYNESWGGSIFFLHNNRWTEQVPALVESRTMYMYRAQSSAEYPSENINAADLPGVLWYLHNEVVTLCPRKYDIVRIKRLKVTVAPSALIRRYSPSFFFSEYMAFDAGQCTTPGCAAKLAMVGANPGCQGRTYADLDGHWYSLPGPCPGHLDKSEECKSEFPGGACDCESSLGDGTCSYHWEDAGDVDIAEVTGLRGDYGQFCQSGKVEYDKNTDAGRGMDFWNGFEVGWRAQRRVQAVLDAFQRKYPDRPLHLGPESCD